MEHGPASDWGEDHSSSFKTRVGIWMFILYAVFYVGFVLINTFNPQLMGSDIGQLNLAIIYGFGLIIFALMLAFVYNAVCSAAEEEWNPPAPEEEEGQEAPDLREAAEAVGASEEAISSAGADVTGTVEDEDAQNDAGCDDESKEA